MKKLNVIKCPKCGAEYLFEEIYYPQEFFGKPLTIIRNEHNKIIYFSDSSLNTEEEYTCDYCNCHFEVTAKIVFDSKEIEDEDVIKIYDDDTISLNEETDKTSLW